MAEKTKSGQESKEALENRRAWRDVLSERNPDLNLDDDLAVGDYLGKSFTDYDKAEASRTQLNDLLSKDERAAGILTGLSSGVGENGEPFSLIGYLLENYGDDIREAATTEEALQNAKEREAQKIKEAADAEKRKAQAEENLKRSDEALTEAVNQLNVDEANISDMLSWLYGAEDVDGFVHRIIRHELDVEDWIKLLHAFNMDADLEKARNEGRKQSKSARGNVHRQLPDNMPSDLGGGGNGAGNNTSEEHPTLAKYKGMKRRFD